MKICSKKCDDSAELMFRMFSLPSLSSHLNFRNAYDGIREGRRGIAEPPYEVEPEVCF